MNNYNVFENSFCYNGYSIHYYVYNPNAKGDVGILLLHGTHTHSGYWDSIVDTNESYTLFAFDFPGQGKSTGLRGDCDSYTILPLLCIHFIKNIVCNYNKFSLYILGESLGALVAFFTVMKFQLPIDFKGLIFMPGVYNVSSLKNVFMRAILVIGSTLIPTVRIKKNKPFSAYTNDPEMIARLENDIHYCRYASFRYLHGLDKFLTYFKINFEYYHSTILIFHGKFDHYTQVSEVSEYFNKLPEYLSKKLCILENSKHWLIVDCEVPKIKENLYEWITSLEGLNK